MERLNTIYNDERISDNTLIIRILNTFLENDEDEDPETILQYILYFTELLKNLYETNETKRPDIKYIVDKINNLEENNNYNNFSKLLNEIIYQNMDTYKYLYLLCYCRSKWEIVYCPKIGYKTPEYALEEIHNNKWSVYLSAFKKNDCAYVG